MTSISDFFDVSEEDFPKRICPKCGIETSQISFTDKYAHCSLCKRERRREIAELKKKGLWVRPVADPIEVWKKEREYVRRNSSRRRALKFGGGVAPYTEAEVLEKWGTCCHLCGGEVDLDAPRSVGKIGWERGLHLEHVIDLALGGSDVIENVKPAHGKCNLKKPRKPTEL